MNEFKDKRDAVPTAMDAVAHAATAAAPRAAGLVPAPSTPGVAELADWIRQCGGGFVGAHDMRRLLAGHDARVLQAWPAFAASWDALPRDGYMADGGSYRSRRYATFSVNAAGVLRREPHQPHYQAVEYNTLNGGIKRHFEAIADAVAEGPALQAALRLGADLSRAILPGHSWHVEAHQFRIQAHAGMAGQPTPEGVHRDGVDVVLVLLMRRVNVRSGTTSVHGADRSLLGSFTLAEPFDAALLDDRRCYHGVTPIEQIDPGQAAFRDVLVVTYRRLPAGQAG